ncbi:dienelactone hydrolase family protein [Halomonas koreensis]|uniref:Dienelactone hydrolase family protein n=1 Tax=Halomonas koreensis TaxID=245385 RepID=A0ABU1G1L2_9GAMM|nr:dienelactone hydrolase family protein [Halomonas koreensis]MDR5866769.1 dienelactone hydrolase family protein [Halomonas koreensis]
MTRAPMPLLLAALPLLAEAGQPLDYRVGEEAFTGYFAPAPDESRGTVLIVHDWDGLTDYERRRAEMLADQGYDAFALDLYGRGNRPVETAAKKAETARLYEDRERMRALTLAGLAEARARGAALPTVVMGYCFGGAVVLELARSGEARDVYGYATFHGGLATPEDQGYGPETPPILIAHGGADAAIPMADVAALSRELEAAGVAYEIEIYSGAPHAFTVFDSGRYQARADTKSWAAFQALLDEAL